VKARHRRPASRYETLAAEWLRALRGSRSQVAFSRRLGYRSNVAYRWEAGECFPTAGTTLGAVDRLGGSVSDSLATFHRRTPSWLASTDFGSAAGVGRLLDHLRGRATFQSLAALTALNRFSLSRWMNGDADPPLPAFLALIEATTLRLLDFLSAFVDPGQLPSVAEEWRRLEQAREMAYTHPWTQAVLRGLELEGYRCLSRHQPGWLAQRAGISVEREREALSLLERTGQVVHDGSKYRPQAVQAVDTRTDPERARQLKAYWTETALSRLKDGDPGLFAYNLSAISRADLEKLQELQRAHYREMSRVIAASESPECVVLYAAQLLSLEREPSAADDVVTVGGGPHEA
jgi:hypothetical protein